MPFEILGIGSKINAAISAMGYTDPTPIQEEAIPYLLSTTNDLIALAQTGTGKTAAFGLPILEQIDYDSKAIQALILCPTRELCIQISKEFELFSTNLGKLRSLAVYGGAPIGRQISQLERGVQVVIGTPGRTLDMVKRNKLKVDKMRWLVLDEADEMLNMGFKDDLEAIMANMPKNKQTLLFSATLPSAIEHLTKQYMNNPKKIAVARQNIGSQNVEHHFYITKNADRYNVLQRLVDINADIYAIIFCRTKNETKDIAVSLIEAGYNADTLHGDLNQSQRDAVMNSFRNKKIRLLVATDVASRGLDVNDLTHVINYNLPDDPEVYVHRSGRTGRAGKNGICLTIINSREGRRLAKIEKMVGKEFHKKEIPNAKEVLNLKVFNYINELAEQKIDLDLIKSLDPKTLEKIGGIEVQELFHRMLSKEFGRLTDQLQDEKSGNKNNSKSRDKFSKNNHNTNYVGYSIQMGKKDQMNPNRLMALVNEQTNSKDIPFGKIIVHNKSTQFEIDSEYKMILESSFEGLEHNDKPILERTEINEKSHSKRNYNRKSSGNRSSRKKNSNRKGKRRSR